MTGLINWIVQVAELASFNLRTIPERRGSAVSSMVGIAGVVIVLVGVLSIAAGFRQAMVSTGSPSTAVVLRSGSDSEMTSGLGRDEVRLIEDAPGIARDASGPLASAELFVIINLPKRSTGTDANVSLRGISPAAYAVRGNIRMIAGRRFTPGRNEVIVGAAAAGQFAGLDLGRTIRIGQNDWHVVGIFSSGGDVSESEIWTDAAVLQPAYHRGDTYQSVYVRLASPESFKEFKDALTTNPQLSVTPVRLSDFYAEHSTVVTEFIQTIGVAIASLMALGALFGALNTMYSAVAARTREIATLRALGFGSSPVIASVLAESVVLALAGGVAGGLVAYLAFNGHHASTINWQTFSQVAFSFAVTPGLLARAVLFAVVIGFVGGLFPAVRAARMPVAAALRET